MATTSDKNILTSIFNPFLPLGEHILDNENLEDNEDGSVDEITAEINMAKEMELSGVKSAEQGHIQKSVEFFTKAIEVSPKRASGYNNRAQALRLIGEIEGAERDLERAIELSNNRGQVAGQAYCQRGIIRLSRNDRQSALNDFETAAKLGNEFGRTMTVQLNPYAALCNQMLGQMMEKLNRT